jgi:DNA-binding response OmpR family regulator
VLLVEDDEVVRTILAEAFEEAGMKVEHAETRDAALRIARRVTPDVIVLDRQLPDGDGWTAVKELRRIVGRSDVIVIAMTSHAALSNAERALLAGCEAFLEKPCDPKTVVEHAQRLMAAREPKTTTRRKRVRDT